MAGQLMIGDLRDSVSPTAALRGPRRLLAASVTRAPATAADTLWSDISSWNPAIDFAQYPYRVLCVRSNDGTYADPAFQGNLALAKHALDKGWLDLLGVYCVYRQNWQATLATLIEQIGTPHRQMFVMLDFERWGNGIRGDQSVGGYALRAGVAAWLNTALGIHNAILRVPVYGNAGDLDELLPRGKRPADLKVVLANYSTNPTYPQKWAHQFSSSYTVPGLGPVDINSKDGATVAQTAASLGIVLPSATPPVVVPKPGAKHRAMPYPVGLSAAEQYAVDLVRSVLLPGTYGDVQQADFPALIGDLGLLARMTAVEHRLDALESS